MAINSIGNQADQVEDSKFSERHRQVEVGRKKQRVSWIHDFLRKTIGRVEGRTARFSPSGKVVELCSGKMSYADRWFRIALLE